MIQQVPMYKKAFSFIIEHFVIKSKCSCVRFLQQIALSSDLNRKWNIDAIKSFYDVILSIFQKQICKLAICIIQLRFENMVTHFSSWESRGLPN